jgi:hypothetical protein
MKKVFAGILMMFLLHQSIFNQTIITPGFPITEIFTDFHLNLNDTSGTSGFGLNRAYLGYRFLPVDNISGCVILNAGVPDDLAAGTAPRRFAYLREASLSWEKEGLRVTFGITGTRLFNFQQKFWDKRYIASSYQSKNGYGNVADLGVVVDYVINDVVKADVTVMNGEGYNNIQLDNALRGSLGFTITPGNKVSIRIYGDVMKYLGLWQPMFVSFIGYKGNKVTVGAEFTYKSNLEPVKGHHAWGLSGTGSLAILRKTEIFARFDYSASVTAPDIRRHWHYMMDGSFLITGLQYSPADNIKFALNYQGAYPYAKENNPSKAVYLNALFRY